VKSSSGEGVGVANSDDGRENLALCILCGAYVLYCTSYGLLPACLQRSYLSLSVQNNVFV
jgi:hypothetical protein